jgi:hypothetical protein
LRRARRGLTIPNAGLTNANRRAPTVDRGTPGQQAILAPP